MALNFGSFLAGFAKQGTADFEKKEQEVSALVSKSFDKWLIEGPAAHKAQKARKKELRRKAKILSSYNLSNDKIGVILEQGRADEVINYLAKVNSYTGKVRDAYLKPLGGKLENIVQFAEGYEETGMTIDQIVEKVGGKISGGMNLSDAFADIGQKKENVFANLLTPNVSNIVSKRKKMYESIYGKGAIESALAGATGTVDAEGMPTNLNPYTGLSTSDVTFNMPDVEESKRIEKLLVEDKDFRTVNYVTRGALNYASTLIDGATATPNQVGDIKLFIPPDITKKHNAITTAKIIEQIDAEVAIRANPTTGKLSDQDLIEIKQKIKGYIDTNMTQQQKTNQQKIEEMSETKASDRYEALKKKVKNKLVLDDPSNPNAIPYPVWKEEFAMLMIKLGEARTMEEALKKAYDEFRRLTDEKDAEDKDTGALNPQFKGYGNIDPKSFVGG